MIYVFSGLGADERVFKNLDFGGLPIQFIQWKKPTGLTIGSYAADLLSQIQHAKPILLGLSFGGMLAVEVSKLIETEKVILIASAKNADEIPSCYQLSGKMKIHQVFPYALAKKPGLISDWFFGNNNPGYRQLMREMVRDIDTGFLKWAVNSILCWENKNYPENLVHIHGTKDRILPFKPIKNVIPIQGGGHLMTLTHSKEVNEILKKQLN